MTVSFDPDGGTDGYSEALRLRTFPTRQPQFIVQYSRDKPWGIQYV